MTRSPSLFGCASSECPRKERQRPVRRSTRAALPLLLRVSTPENPSSAMTAGSARSRRSGAAAIPFDVIFQPSRIEFLSRFGPFAAGGFEHESREVVSGRIRRRSCSSNRYGSNGRRNQSLGMERKSLRSMEFARQTETGTLIAHFDSLRCVGAVSRPCAPRIRTHGWDPTRRRCAHCLPAALRGPGSGTRRDSTMHGRRESKLDRPMASSRGSSEAGRSHRAA